MTTKMQAYENLKADVTNVVQFVEQLRDKEVNTAVIRGHMYLHYTRNADGYRTEMRAPALLTDALARLIREELEESLGAALKALQTSLAEARQAAREEAVSLLTELGE